MALVTRDVGPGERLRAARLYLCTDSRRAQGDLPDFLDRVLGAGVDVVQLRDKTLEAREELALHEQVAAAAERHGALWAVNDRADVAALAGAPVLHVGQGDVRPVQARGLLGEDVLVGLSTHGPDQLVAALDDPDVAYVCCGPVHPTPTKPGRPATGLAYVEHAAGTVGERLPWFAIGGVDLTTVDAVVEAGASRAVVVRAVTQADDPADAVRRLRARLERG